MNENIFRTGPPAWSLRTADRVDGPGVPGSSPGGGELQAASGGASSPGRSTSLPLTKTAPARTRTTRCGALTARHRSRADSISLKAMASPAAREPGPLMRGGREPAGERAMGRCLACAGVAAPSDHRPDLVARLARSKQLRRGDDSNNSNILRADSCVTRPSIATATDIVPV